MKVPASLFISFAFIILSSCGGGNSSFKTQFSTSAVLSEERNLVSNERNIAARICYAYKSKSQNFRSSYIGSHFFFNSSNTDCANNTTTPTIDSGLQYGSNNELIFFRAAQTPALKFMATVQTDTNGYLSQLCDKIQNNQTISNTTTSGNTTVQITFFTEDLDGYFLQYFVKQTDGSFKIDSAEKFKVRTQTNYKSGQILGMDKFYSFQKSCTNFDKAKNSNFEQTSQVD